MGLKALEVATSVGFGAVDIFTEEVDAWKGYTKPFENITDWLRVGALAVGYAGPIFKIIPEEVGNPLVIADIPLVEKTIRDGIKTWMGIGTPYGRFVGLRLKKTGSGTEVTPPRGGGAPIRMI